MASVSDRLAGAIDAADEIARILERTSGASFGSDPILLSAIKYHFIVLAEALNAASKLKPDLSSRINALPSIVSFRNVLVHGCRIVDIDEVHAIARDNLPQLRQLLVAIHAELGAP